tara:strand:- start:580 stop:816 length:237 start_codon:yes stop_codon:yes gene_type:complete
MNTSQIKEFINSGRKIITDTKTPKSTTAKKSVSLEESVASDTGDAHSIFIKRTIKDKPKKSEIIEDFKKFVEAEEKLL